MEGEEVTNSPHLTSPKGRGIATANA